MQANWNCKEYDLMKEGEKIKKKTLIRVFLYIEITLRSRAVISFMLEK